MIGVSSSSAVSRRTEGDASGENCLLLGCALDEKTARLTFTEKTFASLSLEVVYNVCSELSEMYHVRD